MVCFVYVTVQDADEAGRIAYAVVNEKLAACANILPGMTSVYRWQGKMEAVSEAVLILKTQDSLFQKLEARIKELHSYDVPCIVALPIGQGAQEFLDWIGTETTP